MHHFNFYLPDEQRSDLYSLSSLTGESSAEWLRRMITYCCQPQVLCNLVPPYLSGQISVGGR